MATRIYRVTSPSGIRLVDAANKSTAVAFVTREEISAEVATGHEIAELVGNGTKVERTTCPATADMFEAEPA